MRTLIKLVFALIILVIAGLIALPFIVDPNDYKQEISSQVEQATGRTLTLEGDIELSVFPWIALELGPLSLSNAKGFKADTFAEVKAAEIRIKLMPLLSKQLEMDTVILDGLVLNLEKNKAGKTNWDDLAGEAQPARADDDTTKSSSKSDPNSAPALAAISIAGVQLTEANILWSDASSGESYNLQNFNLTTDPLVPGEPTAIDLNFEIASSKPQANAQISLTTKVMVDLDKQQYALSDLRFTTNAQAKDFAFSQAEVSLNGDINADMISQTVTLEGLSLNAKVENDQQAIDAKFTADITSNLANQQSSLKGVNLVAEVVDPALPGGEAKLNFSTDITTDLEKQTISLANLIVEIQDLLINGDLNANQVLSDSPAFAGNIDVKAFNLRQLAKQLAIELPVMSDDSTLELVKISSQFAGTTNSINAKSLNITLDQSTLSGNLAINDFANPAINFKLALDEIDVDRYLPPVTEEETPTQVAPPAASAAAGASQLPLEDLRKINAKGTVDIGKLKVSGTNSENIHIELNAAKGNIKLKPMSADLYQGHYQGGVTLDARGKTLKLAIDEKLQDVQAGPLLMDLTGDDTLSGVANASAKLSGNGATVEQIKQTLSGNGQFSFTDGALKGVNIAESIRKAKAALKGQTLPESTEAVKTDFSALSGSFKATNGVIDNQDLLAMSPLLRINGAGLVDLAKENINYGLKVSIVGTSSGQGGEELADLKGLSIPVKITGTFSEPKPSVDLANLFKEQATAEVKAKVTEKLKEKLGGDLGALLGGSLGVDSETEESKESSESTAETSTQQAEPAESPEKQLEDAVKNKLKGFF